MTVQRPQRSFVVQTITFCAPRRAALVDKLRRASHGNVNEM